MRWKSIVSPGSRLTSQIRTFVLEDDPLPDFTERDAFSLPAFSPDLSVIAGHRLFGRDTAMALISIR
jgi:hypothetical protein